MYGLQKSPKTYIFRNFRSNDKWINMNQWNDDVAIGMS